MRIRVIKFGGSLLGGDSKVAEFRSWLACQTPARNMLVAGGGETVNDIRDWQKQYDLDDSRCHWMSISAMGLTAILLHRLLPGSEWTDDIDSLRRSTAAMAVFDPQRWLGSQRELPESWSVTSDSIAAVFAREIAADELVLLKSRLPGRHVHCLSDLATDGLTDVYFPDVAIRLPRIRLVDLRETGEEIQLVNHRKPTTL